MPLEQFYDSHGAAYFLNVSLQTVHRLVRSGRLPAYRLGGGRRLRFSESDIKACLGISEKPPAEPQPPPVRTVSSSRKEVEEAYRMVKDGLNPNRWRR